ncbi:MAG: hypothetical protein ACKV2T_37815 [Kofleriaceae bacterium]
MIRFSGLVVAFAACERAGSPQRVEEGSNAILPAPADAAIVDATLDAGKVVIVNKSDLPIWTEIDGPRVRILRDGTKTLAGVSFTFAGYGSGTGPNGSLAMIGLVAKKGATKEELNLSSRGRDPEFTVFGRGFVITSIGGTEIEITSVTMNDADCAKKIGELVDKLGIREQPKPDEISGFTISGDGFIRQNHNGFEVECGGVTGRLSVTEPGLTP